MNFSHGLILIPMKGAKTMDVIDLIREAKKGNREVLVKLIMDKKEEYYRLAYAFMGNKEDSLDALQDTIVILFDNIKKLREPKSFYSWSKKILVNTCKSMLKRRKRVLPIGIDKEEEFIENYQNRELKHDIMKCLKRLNIHQQEAIILRCFMDMDYETISRLTEVSEGTVKSRIFNGLAKLRRIFGGEYQ
jgi:RNA polymerase sigma factor (sigma-70 family)